MNTTEKVGQIGGFICLVGKANVVLICSNRFKVGVTNENISNDVT
jgi:hypothetical protein